MTFLKISKNKRELSSEFIAVTGSSENYSQNYAVRILQNLFSPKSYNNFYVPLSISNLNPNFNLEFWSGYNKFNEINKLSQ